MTAPTLDPETTAVVLRSAADRISVAGLWLGRVSPDEPDDGCTCTALAICAAAYSLGVTGPAKDEVLAVFARSVDATVTPDCEFNAVIAWNDTITAADPTAHAVAALHRAADAVLAVAP